MRTFNNVFSEDQPPAYYPETDADKEAAMNAAAVSDHAWESFVGHTVLPTEVEVQPAAWEDFGLSVQQNPSIAI